MSVFLSLFVMMNAADKNAVRIYAADGSMVTYLLSVKPSVSFSSDALILKTTDVEVVYPLNPSVRFEFAEVSDATTSIQSAQTELSCRITTDEIEIYNVRPNSVVSIYNLSGVTVKSGRANGDGWITMNSINIPKGTYIVKSEQVTFKIFVK